MDAHQYIVQKLVDTFVKPLGYINSYSGAEIVKQMPSDYAAGSDGMVGCGYSINSTQGMANGTGMIDASAARKTLNVLRQSNPDVNVRTDSMDLSKTCSNEFAKRAPRS